MEAALLIGARLLQFGGVLTLFGAPLFYRYGMEPGVARAPSRWSWQHRVVLGAACAAFLGTLTWVMAETASFSDEASDAFSPTAVWTVLWQTRFGRACLARMALLALSFAASLLIRRMKLLWISQPVLAAGATASFLWTGHGAMNAGAAGVVHVIADLLHLLTAGIWIGALLPLAVLVSRSMRSRQAEDESATLLGLNRFSAIGIWVVAVLVLSGIANSWFLIGPRWRGLFTSGYGVALLVKLGLFGLMMVLAALNRYRTTPALRNNLAMRAAARPAVGSLKLTILSETGLAFLVLLAVSVLGTLAPPVSGE